MRLEDAPWYAAERLRKHHEILCIAVRELLRKDAYADPEETARKAREHADAVYPPLAPSQPAESEDQQQVLSPEEVAHIREVLRGSVR